MVLSTAIPIVIAAIVIVIISRGILNKPIIPIDTIESLNYSIQNKDINYFVVVHAYKDYFFIQEYKSGKRFQSVIFDTIDSINNQALRRLTYLMVSEEYFPVTLGNTSATCSHFLTIFPLTISIARPIFPIPAL